jgi:hypothetical protein
LRTGAPQPPRRSARDDPDEPQERDAGKRDQVETDPDQPPPRSIAFERLQTFLAQRNPDHNHGGDEQNGECDSG